MVRNWDNHVQMFLFLSVGKQIIFNKNKWSRTLCLCCTSIPECTRLGWCKDQKDTGLSLRELEILHGKWILSAEAQNTLWWGCCMRQLVTPEGSREEQPRGRSTHQVGVWEPSFHPKLQINKYCKWIFCSNQSGGFAKAEGGSWGPMRGTHHHHSWVGLLKQRGGPEARMRGTHHHQLVVLSLPLYGGGLPIPLLHLHQGPVF